MKISIIIPTFNRVQILQRTLPTIFAQDLSDDQFEVIVVNDGSTDSTLDYLRNIRTKTNFRFLDQPHGSQVKAKSHGAREATGDVLLFLDDDLFCTPGLLSAHITAHTKTNHTIVQGLVLVSDESPSTLLTDLVRRGHNAFHERVLHQAQPNFPVDAIVYANCSIRRSDYESVGGFNETWQYAWEDRDLGMRLWRKGMRTVFAPNALTYELYIRSEESFCKLEGSRYGACEVRLAHEYPEYRPFAEVTRFLSGPRWKTALRRRAAEQAELFDSILSLISQICGAARWISLLSELGIRALAYRHALWWFNAACKETNGWKQLIAEFGIRFPVLMYHYVGPPITGLDSSLQVSADDFHAQMEWLEHHNYQPIRVEDWLKWHHGESKLPAKPVLITFDDAYSSLCDHALTELQKRNWPATIFVATAHVGGKNTWDAQPGITPLQLMSRKQIADWSTHNIDFGGHSRTHTDLTQLSSSQIEEEVGKCSQDLTNITGKPPVSFAYPYGMVNATVVHVVQKHFDIAFLASGGVNDLSSDLYCLRRAMVHPSDNAKAMFCLTRYGWNVPFTHIFTHLKRLLFAEHPK